MAQLYPLFSTSKGNATLLVSQGHALLIDCGVSCSLLLKAIKDAGIALAQLDGILLTHEHQDHIKGASQLHKRCSAAFYASADTLAGAQLTGIAHENKPFTAGRFDITPIEISHDVPDPCGYRIETEGQALAIVTDTGKITTSMLQALDDCSLIMLESNYDPEMLACGPYPPALKARIRSDRGHLSNSACASLLSLKALKGQLQTAVLAHLSDQNNTPLTAKSATLEAFTQYGITDIQVEVGGPFCPPLEVKKQ